MASCLAIFALICVLVTTVATIVAFATPNWIEFERDGSGDKLCQCSSCDCGLWLSCSGGITGKLDNCVWFFSNDFLVERNLPGKVRSESFERSFCHFWSLLTPGGNGRLPLLEQSHGLFRV